MQLLPKPNTRFVLTWPLAFSLCFFAGYLAAAPPVPWPAPFTVQKSLSQKSLADAMERKIIAVKENGVKEHPAKLVTLFQQDEVNAYFAERRLKMPEGVRSATFELTRDHVFSQARIDFDEITRERRTRNPLMYLFSGVHNVEVQARTRSAGAGIIHVTVESVVIDGVEVPRIALQFFVERFVNPKYPKVGLDSDYRLPSKMDAVVVGPRTGTVTQR